MKPRSYRRRRPASRPIGICLLLISLLSITNAIAAPSASGLDPTTGAPEERSLVIEGEVEQVVSEMQPRGLIASRATIAVDSVLQGTLREGRVAVGYEGGTVGELTMRVSTEPHLVEGMRLRARLTPGENGSYRIADPDADLAILGGIGAMWTPTGETWDDGDIPVPFRVNPNTSDVPGTGESTAVQNALTTWTSTTCSYFTYSYQGSCSTTSETYDGINCVSWSPTSNGNALAKSVWWYQGSRIIESDITFYDSGISWSTNPGSGQFDVESVGLHELGHSLGLGHSSYSAAVMYYAIGSGQLKRSLHADDQGGVCALYPSPLVPPDAPSNLTATPVSHTQINLSWTDNSDNEDGFKIERSTNGLSWAWIGTVGADVTTYPNPGRTCDQIYYYRVYAYNDAGNSAYSNTDYAIPAADAYEIDDSYQDAKSISIHGAAQTRSFYTTGDEDWVRLPVLANKPYTITTSNLGPSTDTFLELYDTDGTSLLDWNDDCGGAAPASCITNWSSATGGIYFIRVFQVGNPSGDCTGYKYDLSAVVSGAENVYLPLVTRNH